MKQENIRSHENMAIYYGLALITFGEDAVNNVLNEVEWRKKYPDLMRQFQSTEGKYKTTLPGEIVYKIAGRDDCIYDFYASPDGERLYSKDRHKKWDVPRAIDIEIETKGFRHVPSQQALLEYGVYCLYKAVDSTYGIKGEM